MKSRNALRIVLGVVIAAVFVAMIITKQVRFTETAVVETFGRPGPTLGPGLHLRWPVPVQDIITYDMRVQRFDTPYEQLQTVDAKNIMLGMYVCWQLEDPLLFRRRVGKELADVEGKLRDMVRTVTSNVVGSQRIDAFASRDGVRLEQMEQAVLDRVAGEAREQYGVKVLQVRIKRTGLPEGVSPTVMENMRAERLRKAQDDRSQGAAAAAAIEASAHSIADTVLSFARAKAEEIRGQGQQEAAAYYGQYGEHQGFAAFLLRLEFLSETLKDGLFVLDGTQYDESLGWFRQGPTGESVKTRPEAPPAKPGRP